MRKSIFNSVLKCYRSSSLSLLSMYFALNQCMQFDWLCVQDVWHCEICNRKPGRGFGACYSIFCNIMFTIWCLCIYSFTCRGALSCMVIMVSHDQAWFSFSPSERLILQLPTHSIIFHSTLFCMIYQRQLLRYCPDSSK